MNEQILALKKLNAAYIAALEYDCCPDAKRAKDVAELFDTGVSMPELKDALRDNQGRRPDEIASSMSHLITELNQ